MCTVRRTVLPPSSQKIGVLDVLRKSALLTLNSKDFKYYVAGEKKKRRSTTSSTIREIASISLRY